MSIIKFDSIVDQVRTAAEALGETVEENILDYAPSIAGSNGGSVTIEVAQGAPYWSRALEDRIREQVESFTDATGTRCRLRVVYV